MKVAAASDWRDGMPFETALPVDEVMPGDPARCSVCGGDSALRSRTELWAVKHRHPKHHDGYVRFYCAEHLPPAEIIEAPVVRERAAPRARRPSVPRAPAVPEKERALCPDCFVEVSALGLCGMCGRSIA